jgi:hypothetical protein
VRWTAERILVGKALRKWPLERSKRKTRQKLDGSLKEWCV